MTSFNSFNGDPPELLYEPPPMMSTLPLRLICTFEGEFRDMMAQKGKDI